MKSYILTLSVGAVIGSAVTYLLVKDRIQKRADEEIEEVKNYFKNLNEEKKNVEKEYQEKVEQIVNDDKKEPADNETVHDYTIHVKNVDIEKEKEADDMNEPYVISPEEYGDYSDYEQIELTYYSDGVLTDDTGIPVDDVEGTVGAFFADHFGEYEDDSVFIRNDERRCEYEILAVNDTFASLYSASNE